MTQLPTVDMILQNLTLEDRAKHYSGLLAFTRWLLQKKYEVKHHRELSRFEESTKEFEAFLEERVNAGTLSNVQADRKRGDRIWWIAMVETQSAASSLASRIVMRNHFADSVKSFLEETPQEGKTPAEIGDEIEKMKLEIKKEIGEKLGQCLNTCKA